MRHVLKMEAQNTSKDDKRDAEYWLSRSVIRTSHGSMTDKEGVRIRDVTPFLYAMSNTKFTDDRDMSCWHRLFCYDIGELVRRFAKTSECGKMLVKWDLYMRKAKAECGWCDTDQCFKEKTETHNDDGSESEDDDKEPEHDNKEEPDESESESEDDKEEEMETAE